MSDIDDDIEFEPHTPATLAEPHAQDVDGKDLPRGHFPGSVMPPSLSEPVAVPVPSTRSDSQQQQPVGSANRFSHNPYAPTAASPRASPPVPIYAPSNLVDPQGQQFGSPQNRTPVGSLGRGAPPPFNGAGSQPRTSVGIAIPQPAGAVNRYFKTDLCRAFMTTGCPRGASCTYAHGEEELVRLDGSSAHRYGGAVGVAMVGPGSAPRRASSAATMDDGGKMGVAMSQAVPQPSWMSGGSSPGSATVGTGAVASAPIPVSPLAEAMMRPSSLPKGVSPGSAQQQAAGGNSQGGMTPGSAPKFGSAARR